jgi:hypothetical protein
MPTTHLDCLDEETGLKLRLVVKGNHKVKNYDLYFGVKRWVGDRKTLVIVVLLSRDMSTQFNYLFYLKRRTVLQFPNLHTMRYNPLVYLSAGNGLKN